MFQSTTRYWLLHSSVWLWKWSASVRDPQPAYPVDNHDRCGNEITFGYSSSGLTTGILGWFLKYTSGRILAKPVNPLDRAIRYRNVSSEDRDHWYTVVPCEEEDIPIWSLRWCPVSSTSSFLSSQISRRTRYLPSRHLSCIFPRGGSPSIHSSLTRWWSSPVTKNSLCRWSRINQNFLYCIFKPTTSLIKCVY